MNNDPNQPQPASDGQQQPPWDQQSATQQGQPLQPPPYESQPQWEQQPPLQYRQPPYGQLPDGASPIPNYWPPQQPKKRSRRWLWITLSIVGGVIALSCAICAITAVLSIGFLAPLARAEEPVVVVQSYYQAIERQDYTQAYTYLDSNATFTVDGQPVAITQAYAFTTEATMLDNTLGPVSSFSLVSIHPNDFSRINVSVTRKGSSYLVHLQLKQVGSDWKITSADGI